MLDEADREKDRTLARHLIAVAQAALREVTGERQKQTQEATATHFTKQELQTFVKYARGLRPKMTEEVRKWAGVWAKPPQGAALCFWHRWEREEGRRHWMHSYPVVLDRLLPFRQLIGSPAHVIPSVSSPILQQSSSCKP